MGLAAKGMVVVFVVFTALNVDFANGIYLAFRGWIEKNAGLVSNSPARCLLSAIYRLPRIAIPTNVSLA